MYLSGTLEGIGPNKSGITNAPARDYGFVSMQANATTNPPAHMSLDSTGINKAGGDSSATCANEVITTNDTAMLPVPGGTLENGNDNFGNWR